LNDSDLSRLPLETKQFIYRLESLGLDRTRIYGFFALIGLYVGAPDTQERLDTLFSSVQLVLPIDRSKNIDEEIGHLFVGYDREINEFCFRCGAEFNFREMKLPNDEKPFYIVNNRDEGLLNKKIKSVEKLVDASRLYDSLIFSLGESSLIQDVSLIDTFKCGVFQIQLHTISDVKGSRQIADAIRILMPSFLHTCFQTLISGKIDYFLGLEPIQIVLLNLMQPMERDYAQQMWGFQSHLLYRDGNLIDGIGELDSREWFDWVLERAKNFDSIYPSNLISLSKSNITLSEIPVWNKEIMNFKKCDAFIKNVWGYSSNSINNKVELYEYKALVVHLIYSSLTSSREVTH
jgi:hypothetical protein